ncbi:MAG TPA: GDSL-type esterase/lipase family protein [Vicinamibacteria bacterium]|nr:GDSL-type esterase/lipase family protein [Vicinamibacteria bacterium]
MTRSRRLLFQGILALAAVALPLAVAEAVCRWQYDRIAPQAGRMAVQALLGGWPAATVRQPHPYLLYVNTPSLARGGIQQHNALGFRGPEVSPTPKPGVLRVLALGGSTTYGAAVDHPSQSWPLQLEARLRQSLTRPVEVINGGLAGAMTPELLAHWVFRNRYLRPHVVVIHVGGNDAATILFRGYDPEYRHYRGGWHRVAWSRRPGEAALLRSAVARVAYAWWLDGPASSGGMFWHLRPFEDLSPQEAAEGVRTQEPEGFRRNLDLLLREIAADGARPILYPEPAAPPALWTHGNITAEARFSQPWYGSFLEAMQKQLVIQRALAARHGIQCAEIPEGEIPLGAFVDHGHVDDYGEQVKAAFLARAVDWAALSAAVP